MKTDVSRVLADNLTRLMRSHEKLTTQGAVAECAGMDQTTVSRMMRGSNSPTLRQLDGLAHCFGLSPWQLLAPDLNPESPPAVAMTAQERDLYDRLRSTAAQFAAMPPKTPEN